MRASRRLSLAGVEAWEGGLGHDRAPETLARVDAFLERVDAFLERVADLVERIGDFETDEPIVTAGGSAYFDRVAEILRRAVLRSGIT